MPFSLQVLQYSLQIPPIVLVYIFEPVHEKVKGCLDIIFALADTNISYATGWCNTTAFSLGNVFTLFPSMNWNMRSSAGAAEGVFIF